MKSALPSLLALLACCLSSTTVAAASDKPLKPCTVISPTTERFFDLSGLRRTSPKESDKEKDKEKDKKKDADEGSWHAKGYDYGANFTLNFCGPVVEELSDVQDLDKKLWRNVSAFYERGDRQYAIGLENSEPIFRGKKLILNYTGGSLCPSTPSKRSSSPSPINLPREIIGDDDDDKDDKDDKKHKDKDSKDKDSKNKDKDDKKPTESPRRKTTIISLLCESDPLGKSSISFVAAVDECVYFFEGRSRHACGIVHADTQTLSPGGVFGVIAFIAIGVYFVGGCVYQRTVMHQRGWRQLPNYAMWAGIARFFTDMFVILTSSCARFLPSRRGYNRLSLGADSRGRGRRDESENRLIDQLDEEWDD